MVSDVVSTHCHARPKRQYATGGSDRFAYMFEQMVDNLQLRGKRRDRWRAARKIRISTESYPPDAVAGAVRWVNIRPAVATRPGRSSGPLIAGAVLRPTPREQLVKLLHGPTVDEFGKNIGQVSLRVEAIQFCCLNQRSDACPIKCSLIVARKKAILFCHCDQAICPLDTVGVHLDAAVVQEAYQATPALETVADRLGNRALLRHGGELDFQPGLQAFDAGPGFSLPRGATLLGAPSTDAVLDGVEFRDALERLARDRRRAPSVDVKE
jgi:hypothetical protein